MLSRTEQETIICFNNGSNTADIYTHSTKLKKKLLSYAEEFPDLVQIRYTTEEGGISAVVPKRTVHGIRSPKKRETTEAQRERMSQIAKERAKSFAEGLLDEEEDEDEEDEEEE